MAKPSAVIPVGQHHVHVSVSDDHSLAVLRLGESTTLGLDLAAAKYLWRELGAVVERIERHPSPAGRRWPSR